MSMKAHRAEGYTLYFLSNDPPSKRFLLAAAPAPYDLAKLRAQGIQYVLVPRLQTLAGSAFFYEQLKREGQKIAEFSPYRDKTILRPFDPHPLTGGPFLLRELWERERNGQAIEIYKI